VTIDQQYINRLRQTIGGNLRNLRMKRKLSLRKLAKLSEMPEFLLDHYEVGKGNMSLVELLKIASAMKCTIGQILSGFPLSRE
jgi:transcriptional regulator with XRE-family HTH domain